MHFRTEPLTRRARRANRLRVAQRTSCGRGKKTALNQPHTRLAEWARNHKKMADSAPDLDRILHSTLLGEALSSAQIAALLADDRGYYVACNDEACRLTGYSRSTLTEFRSGQLAADERSRHIYENFLSGKKMQGRKLVRCEDGAVIRCRYWAIPAQITALPYFLLLLWVPVG